jgi:glutaredoxin-like YruB-family protein
MPEQIAEKKIVVFSQPGCPSCQALKAYLTGKGIAYEDHDVSSDPAAAQELVQKYGSRSTPTVVVGDEVMIGFKPERLDQLLGQ